ncbi:putative transmembrane protein [Toxoplasma gondii MAS]|uniref:Putative transmembrane protein n=1 Tax=Toxoplasma gondii MAS TaxID=943118 RepID=A0A086QM65_TOXGO|nr:putative transmembrane protein [Toxoplasma gondii MAS]
MFLPRCACVCAWEKVYETGRYFVSASLLYFFQAINLYSWVCSRVARRSGASDFSSFPSSSPPFVHTILAYLLLLSNEVSRVALATSYIPLRSLLSSSPSSLSSSPSSLSSSPSSLSSSSPCPSSSLSCSSRSSSPPSSKPGASSSLLSASLSSVSSSSVGSGERRLRRNRDLRGLAAKATLLGEKARLSVWRTAERAVKALLSGLQLQQAVRCSVAVDALSALSLLPDIPGEQLRGRRGTRLKAQTEENGEKEERQEKREDENSLLHLRSAVALDLLLSRLEIEMQTDFCKREDMFSLSTVDESESSLWRMKSFGSLPNPLSALSQFGLLFLSMSLHHAPAGDSSSPSSPPPHVSSCQSFLLSGEQGDPASRSAASSLAASSLAAVYRARALSHLRGLLSSFLSAVELNAPLLPPPHPLSLSVSSLFSPLALSFRRASDATFARSLFSTSSERLLSAQQATWERAGKMAAAVSLLLALRLSFFSTARAILSSWDVPACGAASLPTHATKKQNTDTSGPADEFPREGDPAAKRHGRERSSDFLHALVRGSLYTGTFAALRRVVCDDRCGAFRQSALFSSLLDLLRRAVRHSQTFAAADNVQAASPPALALTPSSPSGEPKREEKNRLLLTATRAAVEILLSCAAYGRSANAQEVKALCVSSGQEVFERVAADASDETFFLKAAETLVEKLHARSFPENEVHGLRRLLSAE